MNTKYDDEIREVESRLQREREDLWARAEDLSVAARDAAISPKGLLIAFAVGFLIGEFTRSKRREKPQVAQAAATTTKVGLGGLLGSALFAYARSRYGSPWDMGRSVWNYYNEWQRARGAAKQRATARTDASSVPVATGPKPPAAAPVVAPIPAASAQPARTPERHAAG